MVGCIMAGFGRAHEGRSGCVHEVWGGKMPHGIGRKEGRKTRYIKTFCAKQRQDNNVDRHLDGQSECGNGRPYERERAAKPCGVDKLL